MDGPVYDSGEHPGTLGDRNDRVNYVVDGDNGTGWYVKVTDGKIGPFVYRSTAEHFKKKYSR